MTNPQARRQLAKSTTRTKVLEAARTLFEGGGYEAATIRQIASWAGMSTGAVFASFSGKAELYREIYGHAPISPEVGRELLERVRPLANSHDVVSVWNGSSHDEVAPPDHDHAPCFTITYRDIRRARAAIARATSDPSETRQDDEAAAAMRGAA